MEDEQKPSMPLSALPFVGPRWLVPHAVLTVLAVALPFIDSDVWGWSTATGAGGFFGALAALDLLVATAGNRPQENRALLPGEPEPKRSLPPLVWLAIALLAVSGLSLLYMGGARVGLWRPI